MDHKHSLPSHAIAIIGMAGRFPRARNLTEFWLNLRQGVEAVQTFSEEEMLAAGVDPNVLNNPNYVRSGTVLEDADCFDAAFFGFTPREAEIMDPQQRIFLESAWEALEDAGYDPGRYSGAIGVYAGVSMNTYIFNNLLKNPGLLAAMGGYQIMLGNDKDFLPTRVSYKLNLQGPSLSIQTACSTSLVAVQVACQGLLGQQCDMALAGGVSLTFPQKAGYLYQEGMILSPDGHCRPFDARGAGIFGGAGVGIVVLKRLQDALEAGDFIYAVIRGAAVNNDGAIKVGYTAPSVDGQAEVIARAQAMAEIDSETIRYIEAHGTGTPLGDPIEIAALTKAFRSHTEKKRFCAIGSVKSNIGHLDAAAGVAGLIKAVLALHHKELPPSLNFATPNPQIDFDNSPFYVNTRLAEWPSNGVPRRAAVSSFGIGGTNAHVILEEAPVRVPSVSSKPWQLVVLSARTAQGLDAATRNLVAYLKAHPETPFSDVTYTLQTGRKVFNHRRVVLCQGRERALQALEQMDAKHVLTAEQESQSRSVVFMFSGQGSQHRDMGRQLYLNEPQFQKHVDECAAFLIPHIGIDLRALLYPGLLENQPDATIGLLDQTRYAQPALFVIEYALANLWMTWGIRPEAMIGHSIGEYVAACLAGVFSLEDALTLVATRGHLMQTQPTGSMLAVFLAESDVEKFLTPQLSLAAVNSPSLCTVSGPQTAIQALETTLAVAGVESRRLHTSHAFHSWMMEPVLDTFTALVRQMVLNPPRIPFISNLTGTWIQTSEATDPSYWARHLRNAVRFSDGLQEILREPSRVLLEVGPGHTLVTFARQGFGRSSGLAVLPSLPHVQDQSLDDIFLYTTLGRLWLSGVAIDWNGVHNGERRHRVALPTYPFERKRYWPEPGPVEHRATIQEPIPSKKADIAEWFYIPVWKQVELSPSREINESTSCMLLFVDQWGLGEHILHQLAQQGQRFVAVRAGEHFEKVDGNTYTLKPDERQHYDLLFQHLLATHSLPDRILHLWSMTPHECFAQNRDFVATAQQLGFFSLLYTAQAIGELQMQDRLDIAVVSTNMQNVSGDEVLSPEKATVLGPCKVIPQEYPALRTCSIDVVLPSGDSASLELVQRLLAEFPFDERSSVIAYRGRNRWSQSYQPLPLVQPRQPHPRLREHGVYLITGGLGGIGFVFAEYLATVVKARLVLTGRTALPPEYEWDEWLQTHAADESVSQKIRQIRDLERIGAEVMVIQADAADPVLMQAMIDQVTKRFNGINGVIHAAGIPGGGLIQMRSRELATQVLRPKVEGTLLLDGLLREQQLDFFVLCSSINAIYGGLGSVDYCAANAFLDAYASSCAGRPGRLTVSINWDPWQEVGMAANIKVPVDMREGRDASLKNGILPREGVQALRRILGSSLPQVVVSTQDLLQLAERVSRFTISHIDQLETAQVRGESQKVRGSKIQSHVAISRSATYVAPQSAEESILAEIWQELLGVDAVSSNDNFFELGGHSLLATQVLARIQDVFKVRFPLRTFFDFPTIAALAKYIQTLLWAQQETLSVSGYQSDEREEIEL